MFNTGTRATIFSLIIYIAYLYFFKVTFAPLHYGFWFYIIAFIHGSGLCTSSALIGSSSSRKTVPIVITITCTIIATSIVLATMVLKQHEIRQISWFWQAVIAVGSMLFISGPLVGLALDSDDSLPQNVTPKPRTDSGSGTEKSKILNSGHESSKIEEKPGITLEYICKEKILRLSSEKKRLQKIRGRIKQLY